MNNVEEKFLKLTAQSLYEAYCAHTNWKSAVTGAPLPPWSQVQEPVMAAWIAAARAAHSIKPVPFDELPPPTGGPKGG